LLVLDLFRVQEDGGEALQAHRVEEKSGRRKAPGDDAGCGSRVVAW
jgi:hypothetical protein